MKCSVSQVHFQCSQIVVPEQDLQQWSVWVHSECQRLKLYLMICDMRSGWRCVVIFWCSCHAHGSLIYTWSFAGVLIFRWWGHAHYGTRIRFGVTGLVLLHARHAHIPALLELHWWSVHTKASATFCQHWVCWHEWSLSSHYTGRVLFTPASIVVRF